MLLLRPMFRNSPYNTPKDFGHWGKGIVPFVPVGRGRWLQHSEDTSLIQMLVVSIPTTPTKLQQTKDFPNTELASRTPMFC